MPQASELTPRANVTPQRYHVAHDQPHPNRVRVSREVIEGSDRTSEGRQVPPRPPSGDRVIERAPTQRDTGEDLHVL